MESLSKVWRHITITCLTDQDEQVALELASVLCASNTESQTENRKLTPHHGHACPRCSHVRPMSSSKLQYKRELRPTRKPVSQQNQPVCTPIMPLNSNEPLRYCSMAIPTNSNHNIHNASITHAPHAPDGTPSLAADPSHPICSHGACLHLLTG